MNLFAIQKYFTPTSILDIGANVGDFAKQCGMTYPMASLFLVEGNPACEPYLKKFKCDYFIGLLSDECKTVQFYMDKRNQVSTGNSIYRENTVHFADENIIIQELPTTTLDLLVQERTFDLIKLDVQGSELDILKGGVRTVQKAKGVILELSLIEYNKNAVIDTEMISYMESINYVLVQKLHEHFDANGTPFQWDGLFLNKNYYENIL